VRRGDKKRERKGKGRGRKCAWERGKKERKENKIKEGGGECVRGFDKSQMLHIQAP
jgi:hypothetical protein